MADLVSSQANGSFEKKEPHSIKTSFKPEDRRSIADEEGGTPTGQAQQPGLRANVGVHSQRCSEQSEDAAV
jgi:hypothetical protein